ncbi:uncharacterized protein METZ01_LOCUS143951 [marine metagenome]|uniref:Uncharacterized protein n=1 Tax=marine metagenome TaxID=408172 RepID=A0A381ZQN1_9ZZZZ
MIILLRCYVVIASMLTKCNNQLVLLGQTPQY